MNNIEQFLYNNGIILNNNYVKWQLERLYQGTVKPASLLRAKIRATKDKQKQRDLSLTLALFKAFNAEKKTTL